MRGAKDIPSARIGPGEIGRRGLLLARPPEHPGPAGEEGPPDHPSGM